MSATVAERPRIVLIHGAATTAEVWRPLAELLRPFGEVSTPQRGYSGDLETELADLAPVCEGNFVVGVSGGATLGLALALGDLPLTGAILHEPAAGSLAPHLLDHVIHAMGGGGPVAFGRALYGESWTEDMLPEDRDAVRRDLGMFRGFEPTAPPEPLDNVFVSVGEYSPIARRESVLALSGLTGAHLLVIPQASHDVHLRNVSAFAKVIEERLAITTSRPRSVGSWQAEKIRKGN